MKSVRTWILGVALALSVAPLDASELPKGTGHPHSALRHPGESGRQAYQRWLSRIRTHGVLPGDPFGGGFPGNFQDDSPLSRAKPLREIQPNDLAPLPEWPTSQYSRAFQKVRDTRFIRDPRKQGFLRRSSWLFPDDGCFARAGLAVQNLKRWGYQKPPGKVFIFGDLNVRTQNSPDGYVMWWYHVVPAMKTGNRVVVFDPAIEPSRPLMLEEWVKTMTPNAQSVTVAFCNPASYVPSSGCLDATDDDRVAYEDQLMYLGLEWDRLIRLKRNPSKELGDFPPWLKHLQHMKEMLGGLL